MCVYHNPQNGQLVFVSWHVSMFLRHHTIRKYTITRLQLAQIDAANLKRNSHPKWKLLLISWQLVWILMIWRSRWGFFNHKNCVLYLKFGHYVFLLINSSCSIFICLGFMDISGARGICFLASIKAWVCLFFMSLFLHNMLDSTKDT